jgi:hypothetical protein
MMRARVFIYLVVAIGLLVTTLDIENIGEGASPAPAVDRQIYAITIEGTVGNTPFSRQGSLFLINCSRLEGTAAGQNRINVWLISGNPQTGSGQGAISLATNSYFYESGSQLDIAPTLVRNFTIDAHFDEGTMRNKNAFSFYGTTLETLSHTIGGDLHIELLPEGKIAGTVILTGLNPATQQIVHYSAVLYGHYLAAG